MKNKNYKLKDVIDDSLVDNRNLGLVRDMFDMFIMKNIEKSGELFCGERISNIVEFSIYFNTKFSDDPRYLGDWKFGEQILQVFKDIELDQNSFYLKNV